LLGAACRHRHHHHCCPTPPQPYQRRNRCRLTPVLLPPPSPSRPLRPLNRPWHHLGPACGVDTLWYDAASAAPACAPLFERWDNCASAAVTAAAMPRSPLRRLVLDLRFSGRRCQSGDGDGSTLTLTLVPGASGAATITPDLPVRRLCSRSLSLCPQGLTGGGHRPWSGGRVVMAVLWLFFGWCVVVRAGIKAPVTSYVCSLYQINGVFSIFR